MPSTNLEKIYTSPYRSFNFQQLFFYDIFCAACILRVIGCQSIVYSVGRGDSSHFPHIYNSLKTGRAGIVCSSVMVVPHMTFMHSEYP